MDRIVFAKQIDSIYEKMYSINESLSSIESEEFIRGYQDGIKEGLKIFNDGGWKALNEWNPLKSIAKGVGTVVGGAKGLYNQGKQMAAKAWSSVAQFATDVMNKIKTGIQTAATWISEQPGKIKEYLSGIYNQAVADMKSAYETLKDKATELVTSIQNVWNQITTDIQTAIQTAKTTVCKTEESAKAWYEKNKQIAINQANELKQSGVEWLKKAGETSLQIVTAIGNGTAKALIGVGALVAFIIIGPIDLLVKGIKAVPDLYTAAQKQVEAGLNAIEKQWEAIGEEYNKGINVGLAATTPSTGKIPVRDPKTGRMMPAGTVPEHRILRFSEFVNEKKKNKESKESKKDAFFKKIGICTVCHKKKCECK